MSLFLHDSGALALCDFTQFVTGLAVDTAVSPPGLCPTLPCDTGSDACAPVTVRMQGIRIRGPNGDCSFSGEVLSPSTGANCQWQIPGDWASLIDCTGGEVADVTGGALILCDVPSDTWRLTVLGHFDVGIPPNIFALDYRSYPRSDSPCPFGRYRLHRAGGYSGPPGTQLIDEGRVEVVGPGNGIDCFCPPPPADCPPCDVIPPPGCSALYTMSTGGVVTLPPAWGGDTCDISASFPIAFQNVLGACSYAGSGPPKPCSDDPNASIVSAGAACNLAAQPPGWHASFTWSYFAAVSVQASYFKPNTNDCPAGVYSLVSSSISDPNGSFSPGTMVIS